MVRRCDSQILTKCFQIMARNMKMREGYAQSKILEIKEIKLI